MGEVFEAIQKSKFKSQNGVMDEVFHRTRRVWF